MLRIRIRVFLTGRIRIHFFKWLDQIFMQYYLKLLLFIVIPPPPKLGIGPDFFFTGSATRPVWQFFKQVMLLTYIHSSADKQLKYKQISKKLENKRATCRPPPSLEM